MAIKTSIENAFLMASGKLRVKGNDPKQHSDRKREYYGAETNRFASKISRYANDVYCAHVQGLNPDNFFQWCSTDIRLADIVNPSASIQKQMDNVKSVLFCDGKIHYIPRGAKIEAAGSTWLVTNPQNISSVHGSCVAERCRTVWNHLDWYGNVKSEPMVVDDDEMRANASDPQEISLVSKGYFNVKCQYNDDTRQLDTNSRMILGRGAYRVTGYADFIQEFTGDYDSVHVLEFTVRYEDPIPEMDDMENHVAGGKNFKWELDIVGKTEMATGTEQAISVVSVRNGEVVESTLEHPIYYAYESTDETVAEVENGVVTAVGEGECDIVVRLLQNPNIMQRITITVSESTGVSVEFRDSVPDYLDAYDSMIVEAAVYLDGDTTEEAIAWELTGADKGSFSYMVMDGNRITIECWSASRTPLTVTARYGDYSASRKISLRGY